MAKLMEHRAENVRIRQATAEDIELLTNIGRETFAQTFSDDNTPENMAKYLSESFNFEKQYTEFYTPGSLFLVIEENETPIGYARLLAGSGGETCITGEKPVELVRIYLLAAWRGKGYGDVLMKACLDAARQNGHDTIWLGVWEKNERAINFYRK